MRRSPTGTAIPRLEIRKRADRLAIEYPDYEERLRDHPFFHRFCKEATFIHENGYVILPGAVNLELCERLSNYYSQVQGLTTEDLPYVEYFDSGELFYGVPCDAEAMRRSGGKFKMIDLFATNETARDVCMAEPITQFLTLLFDSDILAFQQLGFIYGTEQPIHQDTAYVRVSKPAMLAASWIALEDIEADSGELEFIPGSHRMDQLRFDSRDDIACREVEADPSKSVWYNYKDDGQHMAFLDALGRLRTALGSGKFLAKKGDALIWISFLAHGGSKISDFNLARNKTRKSLVTHYCPYPSCFPIYFREVLHQSPTRHKPGCYFSSKLYPLRHLPNGFSGDNYLSANPDVALEPRFREDPGLHYLDHGCQEGRALS